MVHDAGRTTPGEAVTLALAILTITVAAILWTLVYTVRTGISPVPTSPRVKAVLLAALPRDLEGTIFEMGSGWGTLAFPLAQRYRRCRIEAYELSPVPWLVSRVRYLAASVPNLTIHKADFHRASLADARAVVCYLYPGGMKKLRPKLEAELQPGAVVVSNTFAVPGWEPAAVHRARDLYASPVYVYRMPPREGHGSLLTDPPAPAS